MCRKIQQGTASMHPGAALSMTLCSLVELRSPLIRPELTQSRTLLELAMPCRAMCCHRPCGPPLLAQPRAYVGCLCRPIEPALKFELSSSPVEWVQVFCDWCIRSEIHLYSINLQCICLGVRVPCQVTFRWLRRLFHSLWPLDGRLEAPCFLSLRFHEISATCLAQIALEHYLCTSEPLAQGTCSYEVEPRATDALSRRARHLWMLASHIAQW